MSFGGSVLAMIQSLRANARPKHNAFQDWDSQEKLSFLSNRKLHFRKVSREQLEKFKAKNSLNIEREQKRSLILKVVILTILIPLTVFSVFQFFFKAGNSNNHTYQQPTEEITQSGQIDYLLNSGYEWLSKNHYKNARFQFERVFEINSKNKTANYGYAASFVYECKLSNNNCEKATELLHAYILKYGSDTSTELLVEMLNEN